MCNNLSQSKLIGICVCASVFHVFCTFSEAHFALSATQKFRTNAYSRGLLHGSLEYLCVCVCDFFLLFAGLVVCMCRVLLPVCGSAQIPRIEQQQQQLHNLFATATQMAKTVDTDSNERTSEKNKLNFSIQLNWPPFTSNYMKTNACSVSSSPFMKYTYLLSISLSLSLFLSLLFSFTCILYM